MKWKSLQTSLLLSILFVIIYGACNHLTALRHDVGIFILPFEHWIPFVPPMIVPYLSIDLFFIIAPFLCTTPRELTIFRRRIVTCILVAAACFLLFPLTLATARPVVPGMLGAVFEWFKGMDLPYNEFPSLHIALRSVLVGTYVRHSKGWTRWALHVWFSLIGFSTLLVYQHHLIDIAGGFVLAGAAYCLWQEQPGERSANRQVGAYYAMGSALLVAFVFITRPLTIPLLWIACALALVAAGYFFAGPVIYRKRHGKVGAWSKLVMAPVMLGHWLSWRHYATRSKPWDKLTDHVLIGRHLTEAEAQQAVNQGVTAVIDLTAEFSAPRAFREAHYLSLPILDLTAPTNAQIDEALAFIEKESPLGVVYIHCKAGYSRTAAIAGAWLMEAGRVGSAAEAVRMLKDVRKGMIVRPEARDALEGRKAKPAPILT